MRRSPSLCFRGLLLASAVLSTAAVSVAADVVVLPDCLISLKEEVKVPAQEAGVLKDLPVQLGQHVKVGDLLARIDETIPEAQVAVAKAKLFAAQTEAKSTITIEYAQASYNRAVGEFNTNVAGNKKIPGLTPDVRIEEYRLKCIEADLSIKKAKKDQVVAGCQAQVAEAELEAAEANRDHRRIASTLDGEVIEIWPHTGEWLQAGEPLMRIVRMDQLWVNGFVDATKYSQADLRDKPVTVVVELAHGRQVKLQGQVFFVSPMVESGGKFLVRAEVQNRQENGVWALNPGVKAEMTIQLK